MKIEKINDNQIRCTLTQQDLEERHIKLSELAYGTENAKLLFQDMMQQAAIDFGFEAEDIPIMIEAIPLSPEKIVLIITKVDSPEELDTRFSNFTQALDQEDGDSEDDILSFGNMPDNEMIDDLTDFLDQLKKEHAEQNTEPSKAAHSDEKPAPAAAPSKKDLIRLYVFSDLKEIIPAAKLVQHFYSGPNTLFKNPADNHYYLVLHQGRHTSGDFNRANNLLSSYVPSKRCPVGCEPFFRDHYKMILENNALTSLAAL